jgi:hypothetical protein
MTLPAHRFEQRKKDGKDKDKQRVWCCDYDGTITGAPKQMARIAQGLKALGDTVIVLTGNSSPRDDLVQILNDFGFPFDYLVQYHDDDSNGLARAHYLEQFGAWGAFDNRVDRAVIFAEVCPHLYLIAEPTKEDKADARDGDAKKAAKAAAKKIGLRAVDHH